MLNMSLCPGCLTSVQPLTLSILIRYSSHQASGLSWDLWTGAGMAQDSNGRLQRLTSPTVSLHCDIPQGSVLGSLLFVMYTADVCDIATLWGMGVHAYADEVQIYRYCHPCDQNAAVDRFISCFADIERWMTSNRLKLNSTRLKSCG